MKGKVICIIICSIFLNFAISHEMIGNAQSICNLQFAPVESPHKTGYYRYALPPSGFTAVVGFMHAIDIDGTGAASKVEVDWIQLYATINSVDVLILEDKYDSYTSAMDWYGLYQRNPWYDGDRLAAMPWALENGSLVLEPSLYPQLIFHWWNTARSSIPAGASRVWFQARVRITGGAGVQTGIDYWKDLTATYAGPDANNREAGASDWFGNSTADWQIITVGKPGASPPRLAADFGGSGLWLYQDGAWDWISGSDPQGVAYAAGISSLYVDFGDQGLWSYDGTSWNYLDATNPEAILASPTALYVDFGVYGLYRYAAGSWTVLSTTNPGKMVASGDNLFVDFGAGGLWRYNGTWTQLDTSRPEDFVATGSVLYADYGVYGLYRYNGSWALLSTTNPEKMVASGDNLFVGFGAAGLWRYNGVWTMLDTSNPEDIAAFGSTLLVDFGIYGLYKYEAGSWTWLTGSNPDSIVVGGSTLYAHFGAGGLWKYECNVWRFLSAADPESLYGFIP
jgi:hypothetical protein